MTKPKEFQKFITRLIRSAPEDYKPWLFPVQENNKAPDTKISWKAEPARLTIAQAQKRFEYGKNVGISGRREDSLILLDIDDASIEPELKPTLKIRSRSRTGTHAIYWADPEDDKLPCNIPTDQGELRSSDQYVVAPGSYVPCTKEELTEEVKEREISEEDKEKVLNDPDRGYYTVDNDKKISKIRFEELPEVFKETYRKAQKAKEAQKERKKPRPIKPNGKHSALFDLTITDLVSRGRKKREPHPVHGSITTGTNWLISGELGHCWKHLVSLNAIQFLCVDCGYLTCQEAGTAHHNGGNGPSAVVGDDQAIWEAWSYAKKQGYIPEDDPVPVRALHHIARKHDVCEPKEGEKLPREAYNKVLEIIEGDY